MTLHRSVSITIGVPDPGPTTEYHAEFGLSPEEGGEHHVIPGTDHVVQNASAQVNPLLERK